MNRNFTKLSVAALAGAAALTGATRSYGALVLSETKVGSAVTFSNGTYDVWDVDITGMTGLDATKGANGGYSQDAQVLGLQGTFVATGAGLAAPGKTTTTSGSSSYANYITTGGSPQVNGKAYAGTYVAFPNVTATTIVESGTANTGTGAATSLGGTWSVTPAIGQGGNVGGVEPGQDPQGLTVADGGSDPYATNGMLAEVLIPSGTSATFTGSYIDYGYPTGNAITFAVGATSVAGPTHSIISLLAGTIAPAGYGSFDGSIAMTGKGNGSYNVTAATGFTSATTGYVSVTGFSPSTDTEIYALKLNNASGAIASSSTQIATIIADINGANGNLNSSTGGVTASAITGVFTSLFPGYDLLLTSTSASPALGGAAELGFDFSSNGGEGNAADAGVYVAGVAAVPEPATAAGIVLGAAGLLLGRRKKQIEIA